MARPKKPAAATGGNWIVTYSDLMTLLLCFFVMLYASAGTGASGGDAGILRRISASVGNSIGIPMLDNNSSFSVGSLLGSGITYMPSLSEEAQSAKDAYEKSQQNIKDMTTNFKTYFADNAQLSEQVEIESGSTYVKLSFKEGILFDKGSAQVKRTAVDILDLISAELKHYPENYINIEGHTDSDPINTAKYKDNWALSFDRAAEVGRYFINEKGIDPRRVIAIGYGEHAPLAPNDTEDNKAKNRRVEIKITSDSFSEQ